jgi:hypothetical protein
MKEIHTEIDISAADADIWRILTDFDSFPNWNPYIRKAVGELTVGALLDLTLQPSGVASTVIHATVLAVEPKRKLSWLSHMFFPGLFDREQTLTLEVLPSMRVRFTHVQSFSGILVPLFMSKIETDMRRGCKDMNRAVKLRAEQVSVPLPIPSARAAAA